MASKVKVSNISPAAVLDTNKSLRIYKQKKLHAYDDIRALLKEIDAIQNGNNDITLDNDYYNKVSDDRFENDLKLGIGDIYNELLKKVISSSKIKTRRVKNFHNSYRLFSSKKLLLNYCLRKWKLFYLLDAFPAENQFKRHNQHWIPAEISAKRLRKEIRHNYKPIHLEHFFSSDDHEAVYNTKPFKYQTKTTVGNYKTHVLKIEKTDITRNNRNVRSGKLFTPNKVNSFGDNEIDHIDVLSLSGNEPQFLSNFLLGLFGIILVLAVFIFWVKKIFFDFRESKTFELRPPLSAKRIKKPTLVVIHKTLNNYLPHLINIKEMESGGETNSDASLFDRTIESNKSTPYFTPLERLEDDDGSSRFEFPLPSDPVTTLLPKEEIILPISSKISSSCGENVKNAILDSKESPSTHRIRRNSLYERRSCSPQHSTVTNLLSSRSLCKSQMDNCHDHACNSSNPLHSAISSLTLNSAPETSPVCFNRQSCRSPKMYEKVDMDGDKENTIPKGSDIYSPKLKNTDFVVFQQQSPRILEASPTLISTSFSFSPKRNERSELLGSHFAAMRSSPLSSAGYKNGDYFKFPEVDCFSPDVKRIHSLTNHDEVDESTQSFHTQSSRDSIKVINPIDCQARRARLKSISLDSEGAKLVEDNLGVPVEELIERSTPVTSAHYKSSVALTKTERDHDNPRKAHTEHNRKNKNNLTISIGNENQKDLTNTQQPQSDAPKTPTLLQTKQKAISLDSSDSKFSSSSGQNGCEIGAASYDHRQLAVSMLQIASLSMPGTPKRQASLNRNASHLNRLKLAASPMACGQQQQHKGRYFNSIKVLTPSTPSTSSTIDHNKSQGFILKLDSFNESSIDDGDYDQEEITADEEDDDNFFLNFDEFAVVNEDSKLSIYDSDDNKVASGVTKKTSPDYLLGTSLQTQKCTTALSLSNSNLKTLPEVMTLSDFSVGNRERDYDARLDKGSLSVSAQKQNMVSGRSARSSLLQRRGSNHSLTLNLHGSYGNLTKGLSTSNYSLGSNSQYNLSNSIYNLSQHQAGGSSLKSAAGPIHFFKGNPIGIVQNSKVTTSGTPHGASSCSGNNQGEKKNLLQRRGSNTSLTLNIHGSPSVNLNRFSSHSSLNIAATQQQNLYKMQQHNQIKDTEGSKQRKKGLLERRGSNTSLSINLQSNALAVSNINLQGSACSLSSFNTAQLEEDYESRDNNQETNSYGLNNKSDKATVGQHRKFFSSENLNSLNGMTQYSKLNQAHMRSSTKTCFGSVSDLKPYCQLPLSLIIGEDQKTHFNAPPTYLQQCKSDSQQINKSCHSVETILNNSNFKQSNLCSCTGVRNITTRPLSPQTTSEDFKMYLANIQLLQNASNVLNECDLIKLNTMFDKIYGSEEDEEDEGGKLILSSDFQFQFPTEDEQKQLLRNLHQEFWDLPTNHQEKPMVFGSQAKNRYKSILPNEHSRVQLVPEEGEIETPYINANYIKGPDFVQKRYIATQGPLANTIYDFWVMVHQNIRRHDEKMCSQSSSFAAKLIRSQQKIVMLTNFVENNRQKCATYFPIEENEIFLITFSNVRINNPDINFFYNRYFSELNEKSSLFNIETFRIEINDRNVIDHLPDVNFFIIKNTGIIMKNGFSIRQLLCLFCSNINTRNSCEENSDLSVKRIQVLHKFIAYHYWYPDWPDHRSPSDINVLLEISEHLLALGKCEAEFYYEFDGRPPEEENFSVTENSESNEQPLPIIHCSAGIGRTGCMAAILNAICQITTSVSLNKRDTITNPSTEDEQTKNETIFMDRSVVTHVPNNSDEDNLQSYPSQSFPYSKIVEDNSHKLLHNSKTQKRDEEKNNDEKIVKFREDNDGDGSSKSYFQAIKNVPSIYVDILGIVCNLRLQRGGMVQNSEQYELIHRAMCLYLKKILKHIHDKRI